MLKLTFSVVFDKNLKVEEIYRNCNVPRPTCEGCKFKKLCDRIEKSFVDSIFGETEDSYEEVE